MENTKFPIVSEGTIGGTLVQTVNARDLHAFLKVGKDFSTWIKDRIDQYGFSEEADYVVVSQSPISGSGNRGAKNEYYLTIDMGKELGMVERTAKGKEVRQYFIDCERAAKNTADPVAVLNDPAAMRGLLLSYTEKVIALQARVEEMQEDVEAYEHLTDATGTFSRTEAAKNLGVPPAILIRWMKTNGWTYHRPGAKEDLAYQSKMNAGLLEHKVTTGPRPDGTEWVSTQVRVTSRGLAVLAKAFPRAASAA